MSDRAPCRCGVPANLTNRNVCNRCIGRVDAQTIRTRLGMIARYIEEAQGELARRRDERTHLRLRLAAFVELDPPAPDPP